MIPKALSFFFILFSGFYATPVFAHMNHEHASPFFQETQALFDSLDEEKREKFSRILSGHGIIQSTEHTLVIVTDAVKSCGKEHPDLKDNMASLLENLNTSTKPILKKAKGALKRTIALAEVMPVQDMKAYLQKFDDEATAQSSQVDPLPITRLEDCETLQDQLTKEKDTNRLPNALNDAFGF